MSINNVNNDYLFPKNVHELNGHRVKDREKSLIYHTICTRSSVTRKSIAEIHKIRPSTVSNDVAELLNAELIKEGDTTTPLRKGRPETYLHPTFTRFSAISVYVVSQCIHVALVDIGQTVLLEKSTVIPKEASRKKIINRIHSLILSIIEESKELHTELIGIGFSMPGNLNANEGIWLNCQRWDNAINIHFKDIVKKTDIPFTSVNNLDAECTFIMRRYPELSSGGTLLVHWGYGIGASYALRGEPLVTHAGTFGEIGHWTVDPDNPLPCICGDKGCLETRSSLWSLIPQIRKEYTEAPEDEAAFTDFLASVSPKEVPGLNTAIDYMVVTLRNLYQIFFPDTIVFYGPFTEQHEIFSILKKRFRHNIRYCSSTRSKLIAYKSKSEGQIYGSTQRFFLTRLRELLTAEWG